MLFLLIYPLKLAFIAIDQSSDHPFSSITGNLYDILSLKCLYGLFERLCFNGLHGESLVRELEDFPMFAYLRHILTTSLCSLKSFINLVHPTLLLSYANNRVLSSRTRSSLMWRSCDPVPLNIKSMSIRPVLGSVA